jgi:YggT family protein
MALDVIDQIQLFLRVFTTVYLLAIFLHIIMSWFRLPYSLNSVQRFLGDVCEPYLRLWRRIVPLSFGPIDLTPMIAIFALIIASRVADALLERLH